MEGHGRLVPGAGREPGHAAGQWELKPVPRGQPFVSAFYYLLVASNIRAFILRKKSPYLTWA